MPAGTGGGRRNTRTSRRSSGAVARVALICTFGAVKHVHPAPVLAELRGWFETGLAERLPQARVLYWT